MEEKMKRIKQRISILLVCMSLFGSGTAIYAEAIHEEIFDLICVSLNIDNNGSDEELTPLVSERCGSDHLWKKNGAISREACSFCKKIGLYPELCQKCFKTRKVCQSCGKEQRT